jgi:hypothetical protein
VCPCVSKCIGQKHLGGALIACVKPWTTPLLRWRRHKYYLYHTTQNNNKKNLKFMYLVYILVVNNVVNFLDHLKNVEKITFLKKRPCRPT